MRNPFTARRRRFVAATIAAAEATADERAQDIAATWILDADRRAAEAEHRAVDLRAALDQAHEDLRRAHADTETRTAALANRIADLNERCRALAATNAAHGGDCSARMHALDRLSHELADRLVELQRANENTYPPVGIDARTWQTAIDDTRTRVITEKAAAAKALVTTGAAA
ncbi:hypothetical protein B4N89_27295 [Embleya scabrispora]|uniref:Uncharacterized protein n=1 Tax=Embleya scabrispora TaxID=159449 RepID=A0A1T3P4W1_9ACTN|nr:hypothetical protein [Embleya scabrispora]OPC84137.1 hypothetical protein B4N89_27295 [Embleya scabrispora]